MSTSGKVQLIARAQDNAAEVFVINSNLDMVARGIGTVTTRQPPGIYKIKVRAGQATKEELVALEKGRVEKSIGHLGIPSAVPLENTGQSHEYHQEAVVRESAKPWLKLGKGASIFVFARDWNPSDRPRSTGHHPATGLTLRSADGAVLVDLKKRSRTNLKADPWAACNIEINPGAYLLAVEVATGEIFEMTLIAVEGWRTQVFLLQRDHEKSPRGRHPDLASASIRMAKSEAFSLSDTDDRFSELARLALVDRRQVLSQQLDGILRYKFQNPMLGILGGHLLLRLPKPDWELLRVVVKNLRTRIFQGRLHPDVEALALEAGLKAQSDFSIPPMLRASWEIMLKHSLKVPKLIPPGSLGARIAASVTNQDPWLVWRGTAGKQNWMDEILPDFEEYLSRTAAPATSRVLGVVKKAVPPRASKGKTNVQYAVVPRILSESHRKQSLALEAATKALQAVTKPSARRQSLTSLANELGLPPATVAALLAKTRGKSV